MGPQESEIFLLVAVVEEARQPHGPPAPVFVVF